MTASLYRTNAGAGIVDARRPRRRTLSDWLKAPATYPRGPQTVKMLRIGKVRDGSKVGVFIYCQEHAREWGTPLVCLETAERLIRNYGSDPETTKLIDNLDIFLIPTINADGAAYSMYDYNSQRRNMVNYCASNPTGNNDPFARNSWGVDLNRNFSVGSFFDGFQGASNSCTERHVRRPVRDVRARGPQRGLRAVDVPEHQVRHERALQRRLLHVASGCVQAHHA